MMTERKLEQILARYQNSFTEKVYAEENEEHDDDVDLSTENINFHDDKKVRACLGI